MAVLTKTAVANARKELEAALKLVAAKTGIDFSIGIIRFNSEGMRCKLEGIARGATGSATAVTPKEALLAKHAFLLGKDFNESKKYSTPSLGVVKVVGYNSKAIKYPFIIKQLSTGKQYKVSEMQAKNIVANGAVA